MTRHNFIGKHLILLSLMFTCLSPCMITANAGNLNANEERMLPYIYGTFEKDGKVYKARKSYQDAAVDYLKQDDVDLTAEECDHYVAKVFANVQRGIDEGYLYEVTVEEAAQGQKTNAVSGTGSGGNTETQKVTDQDLQNTGAATDPAGKAESENQDKTGAYVDKEGKPLQLEIRSPKPAILEKLEQEPSVAATVTDSRTDTDNWMEGRKPFDSRILIGNGICLILVLVIAAAGYFGKLFDTAKKHKNRRILRWSAMAAGGLSFAGFLFMFFSLMFAGQEHLIITRMEQSGFYESVYEDICLRTETLAGELGLPEKSCDPDYAVIVVAAGQQLQAELEGRKFKPDASLITKPLQNAVDAYLAENKLTLTEKAEEGLTHRMEDLKAAYEELLHWPYAVWAEQGLSNQKLMSISALLYLLTAVGAGMVIYHLHSHKHRGFRDMSIAAAVASVLWLSYVNAGYLTNAWIPAEMEPAYMRRFFILYAADHHKLGCIIGAAGLSITVLLLIAYKIRKEGKKML